MGRRGERGESKAVSVGERSVRKDHIQSRFDAHMTLSELPEGKHAEAMLQGEEVKVLRDGDGVSSVDFRNDDLKTQCVVACGSCCASIVTVRQCKYPCIGDMLKGLE